MDITSEIERKTPNASSPEGAPPRKKTMLSYFNKITIKTTTASSVDNRILGNPLHCGKDQTLAPIWNQQHVKEFQTSLEKLAEFESYIKGRSSDCSANRNIDIRQSEPSKSMGYLEAIKSKQYHPFQIQREPRDISKARKYLHFHEDVRPPYGGTWRKKSFEITGRRPCAQDVQFFDYDNDSEAEWDVGGPGESLKGDDSEDEVEEQDDYEIDMKTFVPHGYVSDDEINCPSDCEEDANQNKSLDDSFVNENSGGSVKNGGSHNGEIGNVGGTDGLSTDDSVQIVSEINSSATDVYANGNANNCSKQDQNNQQIQQTGGGGRQRRKNDINSYYIGLTFNDQITASEPKLEFLKKFQGVLCGL